MEIYRYTQFNLNTIDDKGKFQISVYYERPIILVGTYNKMLDDVGGIFDDLFYLFI